MTLSLIHSKTPLLPSLPLLSMSRTGAVVRQRQSKRQSKIRPVSLMYHALWWQDLQATSVSGAVRDVAGPVKELGWVPEMDSMDQSRSLASRSTPPRMRTAIHTPTLPKDKPQAGARGSGRDGGGLPSLLPTKSPAYTLPVKMASRFPTQGEAAGGAVSHAIAFQQQQQQQQSQSRLV